MTKPDLNTPEVMKAKKAAFVQVRIFCCFGDFNALTFDKHVDYFNFKENIE